MPAVAGSTPSAATNVTVNGVAGVVYSDATFAVTNVTLTLILRMTSFFARHKSGG